MIRKTGMFKNVSSFQYKVIEFSRLFNDFCKKMMQTEKVAMEGENLESGRNIDIDEQLQFGFELGSPKTASIEV